MIASIYAAAQHSPAEHFAGIGYDYLAPLVTGDGPGDEDEDENPGAQRRWMDEQILALLRGEQRKEKAKRKEDKPLAAEVREDAVKFAGRRITWHRALPDMRVWAGGATLEKIIQRRQDALWEHPLPAGVSLLAWRVPLRTTSGLDPRSVVKAIDAGFSVDALDMMIESFAAAELLAVLGMEIGPITRLAPLVYGYEDETRKWWRYSVESRAGYHRYLSMSQPR